MTDRLTPGCPETETARRRPGYRRPHLGRHVCIEPADHMDGATVGWHRCWCGYLWGHYGLEDGVKMVGR